jgi:hypothetical protein
MNPDAIQKRIDELIELPFQGETLKAYNELLQGTTSMMVLIYGAQPLALVMRCGCFKRAAAHHCRWVNRSARGARRVQSKSWLPGTAPF